MIVTPARNHVVRQALDRPIEWSAAQTFVAMVLTSFGYWSGAKLGLALTFGPEPVSALWPPNAIVLAALLIAPRRVWWLLLLAVLPPHLFVELRAGVPAPMVLSWFVSNCFEALLGATIVRHFLPGRPRLDTVRAFMIFLLGAPLFATVASSFLDAAFVKWNGWGHSTYWSVWQTRFSSNILATQTIVPMVLAFHSDALRALRSATRQRVLEGAMLTLLVLVVCVATFVEPERVSRLGPGLLYAPLPLVLWAAVRFGTAGVSVALACVSLFAVWGAAHGGGPFATLTSAQNTVSLQCFLFLIAVPTSLLATLIEERSEAEAAARDSERLLALSMQAARIGVWSIDVPADEVHADALLAKTFGLPATGAHSLATWRQRMHPDDRERVVQNYASALAASAPRDELGDSPIPEIEFRVEHDDGSVHWLMTRGSVLRRPDGTPYRTTGIGVDITERKRNAGAIREHGDRMALAAATAMIGFWSITVASDDFWLSDHCAELLGLPADQRLTRSAFEALIYSRLFEALPQTGEDVLASRGTLEHEFSYRRPDGTLRWIASSARRELDSVGDSVRLIGVLRDVTGQRTAEQQVKERQRVLEHLARVATIGELSATIVHELGQPIGAVIFNAHAAATMLQRGVEPEPLEEIVADIARDSARAGEIIGQLHKLLRRDEVAREALDVGLVVGEVLELTRSEFMAQSIGVRVAMARDLPGVMGNRSQLHQVLLNLMLNARDALSDVPPAQRQMRVNVQVDDCQMMCITVADSGPGIAAHLMPHIFEPFVTSKLRGLGLGLAICRSIMTEHGGDLQAVRTDVGAAFQVTIPVIPAVMRDVVLEEERLAVG